MFIKLLCCSMMIFVVVAVFGLWLQKQRRGDKR
jgi:hypothetical protein